MSSEDSQKQTGSCSAEYLPALALKFVLNALGAFKRTRSEINEVQHH